MSCTDPHGVRCGAPFSDENCPLLYVLGEHQKEEHGGWAVDCTSQICKEFFDKYGYPDFWRAELLDRRYRILELKDGIKEALMELSYRDIDLQCRKMLWELVE